MGRHSLLATALMVLTAACADDGSGDVRTLEPPPTSVASDPATSSGPIDPVELTFHPVIGDGDAAAVTTAFDATQESTVLDEQGLPIRIAPAALTTEDVAAAEVESQGSQSLVLVEFGGDGVRRWQALTAAAACQAPGTSARRVAILADGEVVSSPQVAESVACDVGIAGGSTQITGGFTQQEAQELVRRIDGG